MLQAIREKVAGGVVWVLMLLVGVPLAFIGVDSFFLGSADPVVAKVGDEKITDTQLRNATENYYQQLQQLYGEGFRADLINRERLQKEVLDGLTQDAMMRQFAQETGYAVDKATLIQFLQTIPNFQKDGKFDFETYKQLLANRNLTPERYERQTRDALAVEQLRQSVLESAFVTPMEAAQAYQLQNQERWLSYAVFEAAQYRDKVVVTDEQVKARFEESKERYQAPERIKLAYVELSQSNLPKAAAPNVDLLKVLYDAEKDARFATPETRKARHILIAFGADKAAAKAKIEGLAAQIKAGQDFSELAKTESTDPGSKSQGGDLGEVRKGQMVAEFEKALFDLKAGEVSAPVETQFGWHLIKLDALQAAVVKPFEDADVQTQLASLYGERESQKRFEEMKEKLETLAFESNTSLDKPAQELGLTVQTTDWMTRAVGTGSMGGNAAVREAAFAKEIVQDGENSKAISLGEGRVAVIRKAEYEAPRQKTLEEVGVELRANLIEEQSKALAKADAEAVLKAVREGKALADALREKGLDVTSPGLVKRDNAGLDRGLLEALFKLPRPAANASSFGTANVANGGTAVIGLSAVQSPEWKADSAEAKPVLEQNRNLRAGAEFAAYREAIESRISIEVVERPTDTTATETP